MEQPSHHDNKSWAMFFFEKKHRVSHGPFWLFIILSFALFSLILFIKVDVTVRGKGIVKSGRHTSDIRSGVSGRVVSVKIKENDRVTSGDTLCVIDHSALDAQKDLLSQQIELNARYLADLSWLTGETPNADSLETSRYRQSLALYRQALHRLNTSLQQKKREWERARFLLDEKVLSQADFEVIENDYQLAREAIENHREQTREQWMTRYVETDRYLKELTAQVEQLDESISRHILMAPDDGTLISFQGIKPGHYVSEGTLIAHLSPAGPKEIECYLAPSDIGLLSPGMPARIQVDAYDHNQWGLLEATLSEISGDVITMNGDVYFKVWCHPSKTWLQLSNGVKGNLKKGMTVTARFVVIRRTLFQLLFDKADDWLNPQTAPIDNPLTPAT